MAPFRWWAQGILFAAGIFAAASASAWAPDAGVPDAREVAAEVQVVGVYEGTYPPGVRHRAGFHPDGAVTVRVGAAQKPIILVLTSYEPVVWKIDDPRQAVVRVVASGYHRQKVQGLGQKVPIVRRSHEAGDRDYFYSYSLNKLLGRQVQAATGREIKSFQGTYAGDLFEIP